MTDLVPTARFDTAMIEEEFRLEAWRAMLSASHNVHSTDDRFFGRMRSTRLDDMAIHVMDSSPMSTERNARKVRMDGLEHFVLHVNQAPARAQVDDRELTIPSHRVSINDLTHTSRRAEVPELSSVLVSMSRDLVNEAGINTNQLHGAILNQGSGALLIAHLRQLAQLAPTIEQAAAPAVAKGTAHLVAACIASTPENVEKARPQLENAAFLQARSYIETNLGRAGLNSELLCQQLKISRATLYRMFEPFGGVSSYILQRRLRAARRGLINIRANAKISEVAAAAGFASEARFSREFRKAFGVSPSEIARDGEKQTVPDGVSHPAVIASWIRAIG